MKYKIGTKVKLLSKHGSQEQLIRSYTYKALSLKNQEYAYIIATQGNHYIIYDKLIPLPTAGDLYNENDIMPYTTYQRKLKLQKLQKYE